jgi:hypothetical protein
MISIDKLGGGAANTAALIFSGADLSIFASFIYLLL